jgi:tetratricopeptide (TPR) repeat protein
VIRKALSLSLALMLAGGPTALYAQGTSDPDIAKGIKQVDDGDFDGAILTLDNAARRLAANPAKVNDLSQAYLYLGIAYVGKGHEAAAKAKFREALGQIKTLTLSPDKFPPKVIDVFEAAKADAAKAPAAPQAAEKKGGHKGLLIGLGVAAVGGGVAIAAGGGGSKSSAPTDTRRTETFTGSLCCDTYPENYRSFDIVVGAAGTLDATIEWSSSDTNIFYELALDDDSYTTVARSNRTSNTKSQLSASVSPRTSSPGAAYRMNIGFHADGTTSAVAFTLTVKHP